MSEKYILFNSDTNILKIIDQSNQKYCFLPCSMDHDGASYLNSDSSFNVPIILSGDGELLENFASSSLTGTDEDPLNDEGTDMTDINDINDMSDMNDMSTLENDINCDPESSIVTVNLSEAMGLHDVPSAENSDENAKEEIKSGQTKNLKVKI